METIFKTSYDLTLSFHSPLCQASWYRAKCTIHTKSELGQRKENTLKKPSMSRWSPVYEDIGKRCSNLRRFGKSGVIHKLSSPNSRHICGNVTRWSTNKVENEWKWSEVTSSWLWIVKESLHVQIKQVEIEWNESEVTDLIFT